MKWPLAKAGSVLSWASGIIGTITMYRFLGQFFGASPQEPSATLFENSHLRFLLDVALLTQFTMVHSSFTAETLKRFLSNTRLAPLYRATYLIFSFLSLEVCHHLFFLTERF